MSDFQNSVKLELEQNGWTVFDKGWPDFLCVKNGEVMVAEVKNEGDYLTEDQSRVLEVLSKFLPARTIHPGAGYGDSENSKNFCILAYTEPDVRCESVRKERNGRS